MIIDNKRIERYNADKIFDILARDGFSVHQVGDTVTCGNLWIDVRSEYTANIYNTYKYAIVRRAFATSLASNDEIANWVENNTKGVKTWQNRAVPSNGGQ